MMISVVSRLLRCKPASFFHLPAVGWRPEVLGSVGQVLSKQTALPLHHWHKYSSPHRPATHIARWWKATAAAAALASSGATIAACSRYVETVPYTDRLHIIARSTEFERRTGERVFRYVMETYGASDDVLDPLSPESVRVYGITCQLVHAIRRGLVVRSLKQGKNPEAARRQTAHLDGLDWETVIVRDRDQRFQARCVPGGKIILHSGCLDVLKSDAEIASVIAHEIAHVVARHGIEKKLFATNRWIPSRLRYYLQQRNELEADRIGMLLVAAGGYDPRVFPKAIEKILKLAPRRAKPTTHPSVEERMQNLSQDKVMKQALELYRELHIVLLDAQMPGDWSSVGYSFW